MTIPEFQEKVRVLFNELNQTGDHTFLIATFKDDHELVHTAGYGCQACTIEKLMAIMITGQIAHTGDGSTDGIVKH